MNLLMLWIGMQIPTFSKGLSWSLWKSHLTPSPGVETHQLRTTPLKLSSCCLNYTRFQPMACLLSQLWSLLHSAVRAILSCLSLASLVSPPCIYDRHQGFLNPQGPMWWDFSSWVHIILAFSLCFLLLMSIKIIWASGCLICHFPGILLSDWLHE